MTVQSAVEYVRKSCLTMSRSAYKDFLDDLCEEIVSEIDTVEIDIEIEEEENKTDDDEEEDEDE